MEGGNPLPPKLIPSIVAWNCSQFEQGDKPELQPAPLNEIAPPLRQNYAALYGNGIDIVDGMEAGCGSVGVEREYGSVGVVLAGGIPDPA